MEEEGGEVIPLIRVEGSSYVVVESTLEWLRHRKKPFKVMMCGGKFRTGKSFMLNRFVDSEPGKGFGIGDTVQACTRGVWLYGRFIGPFEDLLVMDTEGIDALDVESSHDIRIFALAVLLGSVFCFNSMNVIDEAAVQTLSLMTRVASSMSSVTHSPLLYWVLRDFALQMVDEYGKSITHEQYLEAALTPSSVTKCATREAIKTVFRKRFLVTLPRPHKSEATRLERIDRKGCGGGGVNVKFDRFLNTFRDHVFTNAPIMQAAGVPMTGSVYADYVKTIVQLVNSSDSVPPLCDAWAMLTHVQHADAKHSIRQEMLKESNRACPTTSKERVKEWLDKTYAAIVAEMSFMEPVPDLSEFRATCIDDTLQIVQSMGRIVDVEKLVHARVSEVIASITTCEDVTKWDMLSLLTAEIEWDRETDAAGQFGSRALSHFVKEVWPTVRAILEDNVGTIQVLRDEATRNTFEKEEICAREISLKAELHALTHRSREDVSTSTEEWSSEVATFDTDFVREEQAASIARRAEEERVRADATEQRVRADAAEQRASQEAAKCERLIEQCRSFEEGISELQAEAQTEIRRLKDEAEAARKQSEAAKKEVESAHAQRDVLVAETDKLQRLVRNGHDKTIEMHRETLEEMRKRDVTAREHHEMVRKTHSELHSRSEIAEREARSLKRRVEELLETDKEVKRLRVTVHDNEVQRARLESESDTLRVNLENTRSERDGLRTKNVELENRISVLEAMQKLDLCRRSIRDA